MTAFSLFLAAVVSAVVTAVLLGTGKSSIALDVPNERSLHSRPVPRIGGIGIMLGAIVPLFAAGVPRVLGGLALLLAVLSFLDDRSGLPAALRFAAHAGAAACVLWYLSPEVPLPIFVVLVVGLVWMTNLYNFMDGADGLAGGMAVFGFGAYGLAALLAGAPDVATASLGVSAAAAGFLPFNHHPARVFMGDVGSIPLGFLAGSIGLLGWFRELWPGWFPIAVFSPFIADATVTLLRRIGRAERFWEAHRSHYYQRLVRSGWGHRKTAWAAYALMAGTAAASLWARAAAPLVQSVLLLLMAMLLGTIARAIDRTWALHERMGAPE